MELANALIRVADEMEKSDQQDTTVEMRNQLALKVKCSIFAYCLVNQNATVLA